LFLNPQDVQVTGFPAAIAPHSTAPPGREPSGNNAAAGVSSYAVDSVPGLVTQPGQPPPPPQALPPQAQPGSEVAAHELDPDLVSLPGPPRRERTLTVAILVLAAAGALAMTWCLRWDVAYGLRAGTPLNLGDLGDVRSVTPAALEASENRFVRADVLLGAAGGIRYERPFVSDSFRALPVLGRTDLWVDVRVPEGEESGRWEPPRGVAGRLVRFGAAGPRHRGLAAAIAEATRARVPEPAWLLVDAEEPRSERWALVLALTLLVFAGWNVAAVARLVRKVR
jgi:hypothetical protein